MEVDLSDIPVVPLNFDPSLFELVSEVSKDSQPEINALKIEVDRLRQSLGVKGDLASSISCQALDLLFQSKFYQYCDKKPYTQESFYQYKWVPDGETKEFWSVEEISTSSRSSDNEQS